MTKNLFAISFGMLFPELYKIMVNEVTFVGSKPLQPLNLFISTAIPLDPKQLALWLPASDNASAKARQKASYCFGIYPGNDKDGSKM